MKNYVIRKFKTREPWLKARQIGGSDLCAVVNGVSRWSNVVEVYDRIVTGYEPAKDSGRMAMGRKAEEPIKELFLISQPNLKRVSPKKIIWLIQRKDYPEITLSPDTIVSNGLEQGFIEIKFKQIFSENEIPAYMTNLKEEDPQYYWQLIHYFVAKCDLKFGYLVICFDICTKNEKGEWEHSKYLIDSLYMPRDYVKADIALAESKLIDLITNNIRPRIRPQTTLKGEQKENIQWNKLSNIKKLRP